MVCLSGCDSVDLLRDRGFGGDRSHVPVLPIVLLQAVRHLYRRRGEIDGPEQATHFPDVRFTPDSRFVVQNWWN